MFGLSLEEMNQLFYEIGYREGELLGSGEDTEQAMRLGAIADKLRNGLFGVERDLKDAIEYEEKNLDRSSFENDADYHHELGYADGLKDALKILRGESWKGVVDYETE